MERSQEEELLESEQYMTFVGYDLHPVNMVQYHDTMRMVNFINPPSTIGIVVQCNRTSGTIGKIWLRIVKVSLPFVNQGPWQLGYPSKGCRMVPVVPLVR
jgi:hypothetical protein